MEDETLPLRVSLQIADGQFFPVFRYGNSDACHLTLVPASDGNKSVNIPFFHHRRGGLEPVEIGVLNFPKAPDEKVELHLHAFIDPPGQLSVTLEHGKSGRTVSLEATLPENDAPPARVGRRRKLGWIWGSFFIALALALLFWTTARVADWGRLDRQPPPLSDESFQETAD